MLALLASAFRHSVKEIITCPPALLLALGGREGRGGYRRRGREGEVVSVVM